MISKQCSGTDCPNFARYEMATTCTRCPKGNQQGIVWICDTHLSNILKNNAVCTRCGSPLKVASDFKKLTDSKNQIRISDKERMETLERLSTACGDGRLTLAELEERQDKLSACKYGSEIEELVKDLPAVPKTTAVAQREPFNVKLYALLAAVIVVALVIICAGII